MDPTSLPTDNLYKFMALSGLGIAGFCLWFIWKLLLEHGGATGALRRQRSATAFRTEAHRERVKASREALVNLEKQLEALPSDLSEAPPAVLGFHEQIKTTLAELERESDQVREERRVLGTEAELLAVQARRNRLFGYGASVGVIVGLAVSLFGFRLWHVRYQVYIDQQTKADFADHMAELAARREVRDEAAKAKKQASKP